MARAVAAMLLLSWIPNAKIAIWDASIALMFLWPPRALWHVARHIHGLRESRATTSAVLPFIALMAPVVAYLYVKYRMGG